MRFGAAVAGTNFVVPAKKSSKSVAPANSGEDRAGKATATRGDGGKAMQLGDRLRVLAVGPSELEVELHFVLLS